MPTQTPTHDDLDDAEMPADCTNNELRAYDALCDADEPIQTSTVAEEIRTSDRTARNALDALESRDLVMAGWSPTDARFRVWWPYSRGLR